MPLVAQASPLFQVSLRNLYGNVVQESVYLSKTRVELIDSIFQNIFNPQPEKVYEFLNVEEKSQYTQSYQPDELPGPLVNISSYLTIDFLPSKTQHLGQR